MSELRKLASIEKEIEQNLAVIHDIDKDIKDNLYIYNIHQIQQKKKGYKEPQKIIDKLKQLIYNGEYLEAQKDKLF